MGTCVCGSGRLMNVSGKTSDMCCVNYNRLSLEGYVPDGLNIGSGDYLEFRLCLECGRIQKPFPITEEAVQEVFHAKPLKPFGRTIFKAVR